MDIHKIVEYVDSRHNEMLGFLEKLVNIDSGSYCIDGVRLVAQEVKKRLEKLDFKVELLSRGIWGPHLLGIREGKGDKKVLFIGHMDTVFDEGTALKRPFKIEGDKAYGPGVCDMKCGIVSLVYALESLIKNGFEDFGRLTVLLNSDEERGSLTSEKEIIRQALMADVVLVVEPSTPGGYVVIKRPGGGIFNLEIKGRASHAGAAPKDGIHAISELANKIQALHAITDYDIGSTVSVGVVKGGVRSNIIPDYAFAEIDLRVATQAEGIRVMKQMEDICTSSTVPGAVCSFTKVMYRPPMEKTQGNIAAYSTLKRAGEKLSLDIVERYSGGGTDGNYTSAVGIPTIDSMGPEGEGEHTEQEYILIPSLYSRAKLISSFLIENSAV